MQYQIVFGVLIGLLAIMVVLSLWLKRRTRRPRNNRIYIAQNGSGPNSAGLEGLRGFGSNSSERGQEGLAPSSPFAAPTTWFPTSKFAPSFYQTGAA